MADITANRYLVLGTAAQRIAFTPVPVNETVSGPGEFMLPLWLESDTGSFYYWNENVTSWVPLIGGSGGLSVISPFLLMGG